jgi:FkbM family methyltransferase
MNIKCLFPEIWKQKVKNKLGIPSHNHSFLNLKKCGFVPGFTLDIGAYEGEWTTSFLKVFPGTPVLMIEAQKGKEEKLKVICKTHPSVDYSIALCSSSSDKIVPFYENETASHVILDGELKGTVQKQVISLSDLLASKHLPAPDFIKIDVQGHEIPVLQGGESFLSKVAIIMAEVTIMDLGNNEPLLLEFLNFLDKYGFRVYDIAQFMRRPYDKALHQADFIFVNKDSDLIKEKSWG